MKTLALIIAAIFTISSVSAQYDRRHDDRRDYNNRSTVTIDVNSNSRNEIRIDGRDYGRGTNNIITIADLQPGQHTLQVIERRGISGVLNGRGNTNATTTFNVRPGYDEQITVNARGRVRVREMRSRYYRR